MPPKVKTPWKPVNFYKVIEDEEPNKKKKLPNPNYEYHKLTLPFRMAIVGSSSSMKTVTVLNLLHLFPETFNRIIFVVKVLNQPLYNYLKKKLPSIEWLVGLDNAPKIDSDFDRNEQSLVVFDDLALEKDQRVVDNYAIRCRHMNVSMMYLSQDWFLIPATLRKNLTHIILKHIPKEMDLNRIYQNCDSISIDKDKFKKIYKYATHSDDPDDVDDKTNFLLIDCYCRRQNEMFRKNLEVIDTDSII